MSDIVVHHVTFSSQELVLRLTQQWRFLVVESGQVRVFDEPIAEFEKRGARVKLTPIGPRDLVRWVAWAIQSICPGAEAEDLQAEPSTFAEAPMTDEDVETTARKMVSSRLDALAKEADPAGGAHEAVALVLYLVKRELLEVTGSVAVVARAVAPLLREVDDTIGSKLEDVLLDLDDVDELFAEPDELTQIVTDSRHIFAS